MFDIGFVADVLQNVIVGSHCSLRQRKTSCVLNVAKLGKAEFEMSSKTVSAFLSLKFDDKRFTRSTFDGSF